ncbi:hypothetical protein ACCO45_003848 [Purpureocillium lilacinum]|uniref:Uncharacterized protein n=1 Tax=Purpureocillium lilacinum TaxID=33203 RepID=A0ACC4E122_PURLI
MAADAPPCVSWTSSPSSTTCRSISRPTTRPTTASSSPRTRARTASSTQTQSPSSLAGGLSRRPHRAHRDHHAAPAGTSPSTYANAALQQAVDAAIAAPHDFPTLNGLHSEYFLVPGARAFVQVERFAAPLFGIATRGAHLTAYVRPRAPGEELRIWVARRSRSLFTYPGMLDSTVAGGVKAEDSPRGVGTVTLANRNARTGLFHGEVLYVYDMEMAAPEEEEEGGGAVVKPRPNPEDREVDEFVLMGCAEVRERMGRGEFKPNVCAVMIDFMVRHGVVTPEGRRTMLRFARG